VPIVSATRALPAGGGNRSGGSGKISSTNTKDGPMAQPSDTSGTFIPPNEAAIVTASNMTELELVMPDMGDEDLPEIAIFLVACAMRFHSDPNFVQEQLEWLVRMHDTEVDEGMKPDQLNSANDD
jgi:hypothetical protein